MDNERERHMPATFRDEVSEITFLAADQKAESGLWKSLHPEFEKDELPVRYNSIHSKLENGVRKWNRMDSEQGEYWYVLLDNFNYLSWFLLIDFRQILYF